MYAMRRFGNMVQKLMEERSYSNDQLAQTLQLDESEIRMLYKGRLYLSLVQLDVLAEFLNADIDVLMAGDNSYYEQNIVHCMTPFTNEDNREKILDFIDTYLDIYEAVNAD